MQSNVAIDNANSEFYKGQYEALGMRILKEGVLRGDRTGTGTIGIFGTNMRFDMSFGEFPLVTSKKVFTRGVFEELKWFIKGQTNIKPLTDKGVHIWDSWATEAGQCGPIYGEQWRAFTNGVPQDTLALLISNFVNKASVGTTPNEKLWGLIDELNKLIENPKYAVVDQLTQVLKQLHEKPFSRRHLVSAWSPAVLPDESISPQENVRNGKQALAACHTFFQFYVAEMDDAQAVDYMRRRYSKQYNDVLVDLAKIEKDLLSLSLTIAGS